MSLFSDLHDIKVDAAAIRKGQAASLDVLKSLLDEAKAINVGIAAANVSLTKIAVALSDEVTGIVALPGTPEPKTESAPNP